MVEQRGRRLGSESPTATMPSPRTMPIQSPAAIGPASLLESRTACVTSPVADALDRFRHRGGVLVGRRLGVVHDQRRQRLGHRARRHDEHGLGGERVDLLGDRDDVLVVRQDHDLLGVDVLDRVEQFGRRRVEGLAAGHDALHAKIAEQLGEAVAGAHGDHRRR